MPDLLESYGCPSSEVNGIYLVNGVNLTDMEPTVKPRRSGQHHGDLRNALEQAALGLVTERGPHGFTLAEACRRAGVSVSAPYKHFADRDALLAALAERAYAEQRVRFAAAVATTEDPVEQLAAFAAAYVRFAAEERALFDVTFSAGIDENSHPQLAEAGRGLLDILMPVVDRIDSDKGNAFNLLVSVTAAAHGLSLFLQHGVFGAEQDSLQATEERAAHTARSIARA